MQYLIWKKTCELVVWMDDRVLSTVTYILKSGKFWNILYEIHFINLNDLKLKIICERIKIHQEFLNMNHDEKLNTVLLHGEK